MTPELHRPVAVERVGTRPISVDVVANEAECLALASRMGLPSIAALRCRFVLARLTSARIEGRGLLEAEIEQVSVVSLEPFATTVRDDFVVNFVPAEEIPDTLEPDGVDEVPYDRGVIDLGDATAEQLALALEPYPRKPGEVLDAAALSGPETPFSVLAGLKGRA